MIKKIFLTTASLAVLLTTGCSSLFPVSQSQPRPTSTTSPYIMTEPASGSSQARSTPSLMASPANSRLYASHKLLDDYVAELAMQLYHNSVKPFADARVAVAGFVDLTPTRDTLHPLGNALAEQFLQQLPRYGVTMVDHKLTGGIKLTAGGDMVFSNRAGQVAANQKIDYVLSGTVQQSHRGTMVHVRIMQLKNKTVLASASQLIPQFVLENEPFAG